VFLSRIDFKPLTADFRAAIWCRIHVDEPDDAKLGVKFMAIHDFFLRNIGRRRPNLFMGVDRSFLLEVVRKWMVMYLRAVDEVRTRFPRTDDSPDLAALGTNWSAQLEIAFEGLSRLDIASRYAEFWAERSITWAQTRGRGEGVYESYEARLSFIGSAYYRLTDRLKRTRGLLVVDAAGNGITAFDLLDVFRQLDNAGQFGAECTRRQWHILHMPPDVQEALYRAARRGDLPQET
jgi:hypothetical protein